MRQEVERPAPSADAGGAARYARAGEMTSVMRAVAPTAGRKILRIGQVEGGRVTDERVVHDRGDVTVGPTEKATFVVLSNVVPPRFKLFERVGDGYVLNFVDGMTGRIALETRIAELAEVREGAKTVRQGAVQCRQIRLGEEARGRVTIGDTSFLFQFVPAPLARAKPQLPLSVRSGLQIDWTTTVIAAISFLFHFGLVGALYSDWLDPILDENLTVAQLAETLQNLPPAPPVETQPSDTIIPTATAKSTPSAPNTSANNPAGTTHGPSKGGRGTPQPNPKEANIGEQLDKLNVQMIATIGGDGPNVDFVLRQAEHTTDLLDDVAKENRGVDPTHGGLAMGGGAFNGHVGDGAHNGLLPPGDPGGVAGPVSTGHIQDVRPPPAARPVSAGANVTGGTMRDAGRVVAGLAGAFRRCYEAGLRENPDMHGGFRITVRVGQQGEVLSATPSGGGGISGAVMSCAASRVQVAQFSPPEGGGATIVIPIGMDHQ